MKSDGRRTGFKIKFVLSNSTFQPAIVPLLRHGWQQGCGCGAGFFPRRRRRWRGWRGAGRYRIQRHAVGAEGSRARAGGRVGTFHHVIFQSKHHSIQLMTASMVHVTNPTPGSDNPSRTYMLKNTN
jgi:hypothetical protein